jgi:hypothetical protein
MKDDRIDNDSITNRTQKQKSGKKSSGGNKKKKLILLILLFLILSAGSAYKYFCTVPTMVIEDEHITKTIANKTYELDWTNNLNFKAINFGDNVDWSICYIQNGHKEVEDTTFKALNFTYMFYAGTYHIKLKNSKTNLLACIKINLTDNYKVFLKNEINRLIQMYANDNSSTKGRNVKKILERIFSSGKIITLEDKDGNTIELTLEELLKKVTDGDEYTILTTPTINNEGKVTDVFIGKGKIDRPIASFSIPSTGYFDELIEFKNESSNSTSFEWSFGDGEKSTKESPKHTYPYNGKDKATFNIVLTITGKNGKSDSKSYQINILKEKKKEKTKKLNPAVPTEPVAEGTIKPSKPVVKETIKPSKSVEEIPLNCPECPELPQITEISVGSKINTGKWECDKVTFNTPGKKKLNLTYKHKQTLDSRCKNICSGKVEILIHMDKSLFAKALKKDINLYEIKNIVHLIDKSEFNFSSKIKGNYKSQSYSDLVDAIEAGIDGWENITLEDFQFSQKSGKVTHFKIK